MGESRYSTEVLECRESEKVHVCSSQCMEFSVSLQLKTHTHKIIVPEVHFHAETNGASPVIMAHKMEKLFNFYTHELNVNTL